MKLTLLVATAVAPAVALLSPVDSSCAVNCGNTLSSTSFTEIQCSQSSFTSGTGAAFKSCVNCQVKSTYYDSQLTDTEAALYNMRYATSYCLFGYPGGSAMASPCITSTACGPLTQSLEYDNLGTNGTSFDYCSLWRSDQVTKCRSCLEAASQNFLSNYIEVLNAACDQLPVNGTPVSFDGTIFSNDVVNATTPNPESTYTAASFVHNGISLSAKVAIAFAGLVFILAVIGTIIVINGKRRRRMYLRSYEKKPKVAWAGSPASQAGSGWGNHGSIRMGQSPAWAANNFGWTGSIMTGLQRYAGDNTHETPLSQKPLRGWDDSPLSATEKTFPGRYFSPYSSQYNSPVSAENTPNPQPLNGAGWPEMTPEEQERAFQQHMASIQAQHDAIFNQLSPVERREPREIGLALGGDESAEEAPVVVTANTQEEFEMQNVESGQLQEQGPQAPVLHHPGYGRASGETAPRTYSPDEKV